MSARSNDRGPGTRRKLAQGTASVRTLGRLLGGKYALGDRVGEGGMGVVHRAEQPALDRTVAIKLLRHELATDPVIAARFRSEAIAAARLNHPNVATVIDYGETEDGRPYLVMEYVSGRPLGTIVRTSGALHLGRALSLVGQVLAGLGEAHAAGIVHGDVKSDNVLVSSPTDGDEHVKLIDFGLARIGRTAERHRHRSADGVPLVSGTPEYMAPEVARGEEPTPAADLYGIGAILYELLTGRPPFYGGSATAIMTQQLQDLVVPPSLRCPQRTIPPRVDAVVMRALAKSPAERFQDARELAAVLYALAEPSGAGELAPAPPLRAIGEAATTGLWRIASRTAATLVRRAMPRAERVARRRISHAITSGAADEIAAGYVELARLLTTRGEVGPAIRELEEAIDLLSGGQGPTTTDACVATLLAALIPLCDVAGDPRAAFAGGPDHWSTLTVSTDLPR